MSSDLRNRDGYILIEAAVAMVLLSIGALTVHGTIQEAVRTRGQAQDYTRARFLLEQVLADLEIQPELAEHSGRGRFEGEHARFSWDYRVRRVNVPLPGRPLRPPPKDKKIQKFQYSEGEGYLGHLRATVSWTRSGRAFSESYETLIGPDSLWQAPRRIPRL